MSLLPSRALILFHFILIFCLFIMKYPFLTRRGRQAAAVAAAVEAEETHTHTPKEEEEEKSFGFHSNPWKYSCYACRKK
jgi:hypothetical protein